MRPQSEAFGSMRDPLSTAASASRTGPSGTGWLLERRCSPQLTVSRPNSDQSSALHPSCAERRPTIFESEDAGSDALSAAPAQAEPRRRTAAAAAEASVLGAALGSGGELRRASLDFGRTGNSSQKHAMRQISAWASAHW